MLLLLSECLKSFFIFALHKPFPLVPMYVNKVISCRRTEERKDTTSWDILYYTVTKKLEYLFLKFPISAIQ